MLKIVFYCLMVILFACCGNEPVVVSNNNQEVSDWSKHYVESTLDTLPTLNLSQLKVITQKGEECGWHALRNLLFAMSMFEDRETNFSQQYRMMVDENSYEKLTRLKDPAVRQCPNIREIIRNSLNYEALLPAKSALYLPLVFEWTRYPNEPSLELTIEQLAEVHVPKIEGSTNLPSGFAADIASLEVEIYGSYSFYDRVKELHGKTKGFIPLSITTNPTGLIVRDNGVVLRHAVSLLIRKVHDTFEYIFMDSLNWKVTSNKNYLNVLGSLVRLSSDVEYLRKSYIRSGFIHMKHFARWPKAVASELFDYFHLVEKMGGVKDTFFARYYKKPTCELVHNLPTAISVNRRKEYANPQSERVDYSDARSELIKLFSCTGVH